jgi:hypothetical protein
MLQEMFKSARRFGLSEQAAWQAVDDTIFAVGQNATMAAYLDELAGALARRILVSERAASRSGDTAKARRTG